ncbi:MAG: hypothetical protein WBW49_13145, partial [Candidatus Acidiferrum sp.]
SVESPDKGVLRDLLPERRFLGGKQRVFTGIPAQEVWRTGMRGVVFAAFPYLVEEVRARLIRAPMQIVLQAALFFPGGANQSAQLGFQQQMLPLFGAQRHH